MIFIYLSCKLLVELFFLGLNIQILSENNIIFQKILFLVLKLLNKKKILYFYKLL